MREKGERFLWAGVLVTALFIVWTVLIRAVDVREIGPMGTAVGFAAVNGWLHRLTGVHMALYTVTDWLGLVPVFVCMAFGAIGLIQLISRRSLWKVDPDILLLGIYYLLVILGYLFFEMIPVNYRPVLIEGRLEASYPSSTTLLTLSVMPTLGFQVRRRLRNIDLRKTVSVLIRAFSMLMVLGRLISGVHWFTDIVGGVLLSMGLYCIYRAAVLLYCKEE